MSYQMLYLIFMFLLYENINCMTRILQVGALHLCVE